LKMKTISKIPVQLSDKFAEIGFTAGMSLKTDGMNKTELFEHIKSEVSGVRREMFSPKQMHGAEIFIADSGRQYQSDGLITDNAGFCLTVSTADCIPLLFADQDSGFFGAVHVGWRGFIAGIIENLGAVLKSRQIEMSDLIVSTGPAIQHCCFEVGPEVSILFDSEHVMIKESRFYVNLQSAVIEKLRLLGTDAINMAINNDCTKCRPDKYYSFRRDGKAPMQMISFIFRNDRMKGAG